MNLIIVESPTKAKTFNKYLEGGDFQVEATMGHIRDLPENKISIDEEHNFQPTYIISPKKIEAVERIKNLAKKATSVILATDADREGEAISYHIAYILGFVDEKWPKVTVHEGKIKRIVFHEITKSALTEALQKPGKLNLSLVDAQQARRLLDRLVGYKVSPLLWKKIGKRWLSAGRVQTVALRFIVEREKEIEKFKIETFFKGLGYFTDSFPETIEARLVSKNDEPYEKKFTLKLFDGDYTYSKTTIDEKLSEEITKDLKGDIFAIRDVDERTYTRTPPPPFTTSTLQQEASHKMGYSSKQTMRLAQQLYERGFITYHRTDSVTMSEKFIQSCPAYIEKEYGKPYVSQETRRYTGKSKLSQEAHEAIRPTRFVPHLPDKESLTSSHHKLYELIFKRALATQMAPAQVKTVKVSIQSGKKYVFESSFEEILFDGYLVLYGIKPQKKAPDIKKGSPASMQKLTFEEAQTSPPPRYNEASLIRTLEARGIGRPSTYAPTISVIQDRQYVEKKETRFYPTMLGTAVSDYLSKEFSTLFEIDFTASLEDELDEIAHGKKDMISVLRAVNDPLNKSLEIAKKDKTYINVQEKTDEKCPECGKMVLIRMSKYGKFYGCSGYPDCKYTRNFVETIDKKCPKCKTGDVVVKVTKKRRKFFGCSRYPECDFAAWRLNQIDTWSPEQEAKWKANYARKKSKTSVGSPKSTKERTGA